MREYTIKENDPLLNDTSIPRLQPGDVINIVFIQGRGWIPVQTFLRA